MPTHVRLFLPEFSNLGVPQEVLTKALALAADGQQAYDGAFALTRQAVEARARGAYRLGVNHIKAAAKMNAAGDAKFIEAWGVIAKAKGQ